jgi:hypothetical protein
MVKYESDAHKTALLHPHAIEFGMVHYQSDVLGVTLVYNRGMILLMMCY